MDVVVKLKRRDMNYYLTIYHLTCQNGEAWGPSALILYRRIKSIVVDALRAAMPNLSDHPTLYTFILLSLTGGSERIEPLGEDRRGFGLIDYPKGKGPERA